MKKCILPSIISNFVLLFLTITISGCSSVRCGVTKITSDLKVSTKTINRYDQYTATEFSHFYQAQSEILGIPEFYIEGNPWIDGNQMLVGINANTLDVYYLTLLPQFDGNWSMDPVAKIRKDELTTMGEEPTNFQWAILTASFPDSLVINSYLDYLDYAVSIQKIDSLDTWIDMSNWSDS